MRLLRPDSRNDSYSHFSLVILKLAIVDKRDLGIGG